jgi:hypothetical protein
MGGGGPNPIDSDGRADFAIYRAKSTEFITLDSTLADSVLSDPGPSNLGGQVLGLWGDIPVPANYGGVDKKSDFAVFRPWTNQFIYLDSSTGRVVFQYPGYGGDVPES